MTVGNERSAFTHSQLLGRARSRQWRIGAHKRPQPIRFAVALPPGVMNAPLVADPDEGGRISAFAALHFGRDWPRDWPMATDIALQSNARFLRAKRHHRKAPAVADQQHLRRLGCGILLFLIGRGAR